MERPLAPPTFLRPHHTAHALPPASAYTSLSAFLTHSASNPHGIPTTQRTQLARLVDALGVDTGQLSADASRARIVEREKRRRAEERAERRRRRGVRREARAERARTDGEAAEREQAEWEAQVEAGDGAISEDEVPARPRGADKDTGYEQVGEDEQEGAQLRDTARDEDDASGAETASENAEVDDDQEEDE